MSASSIAPATNLIIFGSSCCMYIIDKSSSYATRKLSNLFFFFLKREGTTVEVLANCICQAKITTNAALKFLI